MADLPAPDLLAPDLLRWLPASGRAEQLMILLHGHASTAGSMAPLASVLRAAFPQAALLAPEGFEPADRAPESRADRADTQATPAGRPALADTPPARQWFSTTQLDEATRAARVAAVLPRLCDWVRAAQQATGVGPAATALAGFSQGAILALELSALEDGLAGRVLAFGGRYATLPTAAPRETTIHLFHGADDAVIPATHARAALERLGALQGDATLDIAGHTGHVLAPVLIDCALHRLRSHIPHRTWAAAMGAAPPGYRDRLS